MQNISKNDMRNVGAVKLYSDPQDTKLTVKRVKVLEIIFAIGR